MSTGRTSRWSLRPEQADFSRLVWAFVLSLALHALIFGTYHASNKYHLWQTLHWPEWLKPPKFLSQLVIPRKPPPPPPQPKELPLVFVTVDPAAASAEAPKDAKFYSDKNSRAANPQADKITEIPKIDGKQTEVAKTETAPRPVFTPLQPTPAPQPPKETKPPPPEPPKQPPPPTPEPVKEPQPEAKPKPVYTPGDLTLAKPAPTPRPAEGDAEEPKPSRPRTIREALARQSQNRLPGEKMKQEGGVNRQHELASLDTKATPFGAYDAALIEAIQQRWYDLLDERNYASDSRGKVVLQFILHYDGRVTDMNMTENTTGVVLGLICQKAVLDPAPFAAWPSDMKSALGNVRHIQFTFFYN
jgi:outer membrane biosynthesis protein TonB